MLCYFNGELKSKVIITGTTLPQKDAKDAKVH